MIKYRACTSAKDLIPRLTQAYKELHNALVSGLVPLGYWQVQIYEDAIDEITALRKENSGWKKDAIDAVAEIKAQAEEIERLRSESDQLRFESVQLRYVKLRLEMQVMERAAEIEKLYTTNTRFGDVIASQAAEIEKQVGAVLAEQDRDYAEKTNRMIERHAAQLALQASEIAAHKLHIEKLYSKLENRAREFSPGDKS